VHWESWCLRLALLVTGAYQVISGNTTGAMVAGEGLVVSLVPLLVGRLSKTHVPRPLEFAFVLGMALQFISESTKLFELFTYWDKVVHPTLIAQLATLMTICTGIFAGVLWELVEFVLDWVRYSDLQKSNSDTMTDFLWNDVGAVIGALLAARWYCQWLRSNERAEISGLATWLIDGPSRVLERHGFLVTTIVAVLIVAAVAAVWFAGRPVPGLGNG
jgi:hypothetical protein